MVMQPEPWGEALDDVARRGDEAGAPPGSSCPTPAGEPFTQAMAARARRASRWLVFACGRYEGIDQRVIDDARDPDAGRARSRIGDYVLAGGEVAVLVDRRGGRPAAARRARQRRVARRGVATTRRPAGGPRLHQAAELARPRRARGAALRRPRRIARWRRDQALRRTAARRPDLLERLRPGGRSTTQDREVLADLGWRRTPAADFGAAAALWQTGSLLSRAGRAPATGGRDARTSAGPHPHSTDRLRG